MRIHNTVSVQKTQRRWPVPLAVLALVLLTGANFFSTGEHFARAVSVPRPEQSKRIQVARQLIPAGKIIEQNDLLAEDRLENAIPDGTFEDAAKLIGRAASSPIPARAPIAAIWLDEDEQQADPVATPLGSLGSMLSAPPSPEPDEPAAESAVSLFLKVRGDLPPVGSRVAIGIENKKGKAAVVLAETLVESISGRRIQLRVTKEQREYLKAAQLLGKVRLISLGEAGEENPFSDLVVSNIDLLKERLAEENRVDKKPGSGQQEQKKTASNFKPEKSERS